MKNNENLFFNASGYPDPTSYHALKPIITEEADLENRVHNLVNVLKLIVKWAGFDFIGRIQIKDKKTGKEFR